MAYIVFGPPDPRGPVQEDRPFGFSAAGTAEEVVAALNAGRGGFAAVQQVQGTGEPRQVYVWAPNVMWVADD